jgi:hypothetical protein
MIKFSQILNEAAMSKEFIDNLRNEFLQIVSNTKKLTNYDDAMIVKKACIKWRGMLEEYLTQVQESLQAKQRGGVVGTSQLPNPEWAKHYLDNMKILWKFASEIGHFPVASAEFEKKYGSPSGTTDEIKQTLFNINSIKEWDARVRRFARPAWKLLSEISEWASRNDLWGGAGDIEVQEQDEFLIDIDGISVKVVGFNEKDLYEQKHFRNLTTDMKHYVNNAKKNFPLLLKKQLPIVFNFTGGRGGEAAKYISSVDGSVIEMNPWSTGSPSRMTQVIAHEMGHHIYILLSSEANKKWNQLVRGDYVKLDLRDVIKQWNEFKKTHSDEYGGEFDSHLKKTDPILYLQLETLNYHPEYRHHNLLLISNIEEYVNTGHDPIVYVPGHPITGYGGKNSEEAFCEVIGNLVAYGPRTISPETMQWFKTIVPEFRLSESKQLNEEDLIAARQLDLKQLSSIKTFKGRSDYVKNKLVGGSWGSRITSGSGREIFELPNGKILKLAKNPKGVAQNESECDHGIQDMYGDLVTEIIECDDNGLWIVVERANRISKSRFKAITGLDFDKFGYWLNNEYGVNHGKHQIYNQYTITQEESQLMWDNEFASKVMSMVIDYGQQPGDYRRINSWGEVNRNGKPMAVLVDYGLTDEVYNTHYNRR